MSGLDMDAIASMAEDAVADSRAGVQGKVLGRNSLLRQHVLSTVQRIRELDQALAGAVREAAHEAGLGERFDAGRCYFDEQSGEWRDGERPRPQGPPA